MTARLYPGIFPSHTHSLGRHSTMRDLVPGGYIFTHAVFWITVGMVAVGTQAVAIILSVGLVLLVVETATKSQ